MPVPSSRDAQDVVQLLSDDGTPAGVMAKRDAHLSPGHLHRGFSVFLFDETGRVLLQRRASSKYHFAGKWSNACCSHPHDTVSLEAAARSRLSFELGIDTALEPVGSFRYSAVDDASGLVELEDDTVLVGYIRSDANLVPNPGEVWATRFVGIPELETELRTSPDASTPWLAEALRCVLRVGHPHP
jgi:isopentenyl-diphosphate delta-isomerase